MVIGDCGARVTISSPSPCTHTRWCRQEGINLYTGSVSWKRPSSNSIISAIEVIGLVIE